MKHIFAENLITNQEQCQPRQGIETVIRITIVAEFKMHNTVQCIFASDRQIFLGSCLYYVIVHFYDDNRQQKNKF